MCGVSLHLHIVPVREKAIIKLWQSHKTGSIIDAALKLGNFSRYYYRVLCTLYLSSSQNP
jgi:hypothetical protein